MVNSCDGGGGIFSVRGSEGKVEVNLWIEREEGMRMPVGERGDICW